MIVKRMLAAGVRGVALALLLFLAAPVARGQGIIFVTPDPSIYYAPVPVSYNIDITGSGSPDFVLVSDGVGGSFLYPQGNNSLIVVPVPDYADETLVAALNPGDSVGAAPSSLDPVYQWYDPSDPVGYSEIGSQAEFGGPTYATGYFVGQAIAYIGFDLVRSGQNYYGWMQVANPYPVNSGQIVDWAYESTPNTPIAAGAVPEPGTWALLVAGSVWLRVHRKLAC